MKHWSEHQKCPDPDPSPAEARWLRLGGRGRSQPLPPLEAERVSCPHFKHFDFPSSDASCMSPWQPGAGSAHFDKLICNELHTGIKPN